LHGSISPSGQIAVSKGSSKTFVITPARGYKVARVRINGASIGAVTSYTFSNIKTNSTITAEFKR
jgi:outer membrane lipoprotein-sorting protein